MRLHALSPLTDAIGPIIRINPYEVHIMDSEFLDELFVGSSKRKTNKWYWSVRKTNLWCENRIS